jgi:hypothetical protein
MSELEILAEKLRSAALDASNPGYPGRFRLVLAITFRHCPSDLNASVRERFDEPFEQQHVCWELNAVQGPWAEQESDGELRWLEVQYKDLKAVQKGIDFLLLVYRHLVLAAGASA